MPIELLRQLSEQSLPVTITDLADIDKLRVLRAAGQVACTMNAPGSADPFARVMAITKEGRAALALDDVRRRRKRGPGDSDAG